MHKGVIAIILILVVGVVLYTMQPKPVATQVAEIEDEKTVEKIPAATREAPPTVIPDASSTVTPPVISETAVNPAQPPIDPEQAKASIQAYLDKPDPRTPALVEKPAEKAVKATEEELKNPEQYADFESRLNQHVATTFMPSKAQISRIEQTIQAADASGQQSPEALQEAQNALQKLEELRTRMLDNLPEKPSPK